MKTNPNFLVLATFLLLVVSSFFVLAFELPGPDPPFGVVEHRGKMSVEDFDFLKRGEGRVNLLVQYEDGFDEGKLDKYNSGLRVGRVESKVSDLGSIISDRRVGFVEIDRGIRVLDESVPWGVGRVGAPGIWNSSVGGGVKVAVMDTGVGPHSDLWVVGGWSAFGYDYLDSHGHGTAVAGVLAGLLNDLDLVGVSPGVELYSVRVMEGSTGSVSDVIDGLNWAVENDMDVVVMSFGLNGYSQLLKEVVEDAYDSGILMIAASGNDGSSVLYPAAYDDVIAVGATDSDDVLADFSSRGFEQELVAPGEDVLTLELGGIVGEFDGTSLSAPHVAGVASLVWSVNPLLSNVDVRAHLRNSAQDLGVVGKDDLYGYGLVQTDLEVSNLSLGDDSYYYEVFSIQNFGEWNEELILYANGAGSIGDVDFTEGYYRVVKYVSPVFNETVFVSENGSVVVLLSIGYLRFEDNYDEDSDRAVWVDGTMSYRYTDDAGVSPDADVVCFDTNYISSFTFDKCRSAAGVSVSDCYADFEDLELQCDFGGADCVDGGLSSWYPIPSSMLDSRGENEIAFKAFYSCGGSAGSQLTSYKYYAFDHKRTICAFDDFEFFQEGQYSSSLWDGFGNDIACSGESLCDDTVAGTYETSNKNYDFTVTTNDNYPCRLPVGESCNTGDSDYSNDCLDGLTCTGGVCTAPSNQTVDLAITQVIPLQVIPDVSMVKGKSGFIVVNVSNIGETIATGNVTVRYESNILALSSETFSFSNDNPRSISVSQSALFVFDFKPMNTGSHTVNASVEVLE